MAVKKCIVCNKGIYLPSNTKVYRAFQNEEIKTDELKAVQISNSFFRRKNGREYVCPACILMDLAVMVRLLLSNNKIVGEPADMLCRMKIRMEVERIRVTY